MGKRDTETVAEGLKDGLSNKRSVDLNKAWKQDFMSLPVITPTPTNLSVATCFRMTNIARCRTASSLTSSPPAPENTRIPAIIKGMLSSHEATTHPFQTDDPRLRPIYGKVLAGTRLDASDALALYRTGDILAVGWMANLVRERMHGDQTYFNVNRHINPTNVCVAACRLCAFGRKKDAPGAYTMALEEAFETAASGYTEAVTEFHIVGGLHPDLPFQYFLDLCSGLKQRFPQVHLKAFTMVEVAYLSKRAKLSIRETLERLKASGVDSLPGGGAEIFADRVRHIICDHKIDGDQGLETARLAHQIGLKSNATMLYGHVENDEDRVDHLLKLRALQDET